MSKNSYNPRPILSITFPQGFQKSLKKIGHWTLGSGGKTTFKQSKQMTKISLKKIRRGNFTPFLSKNVQIWNHFLPLLFPKDLEQFGHWTLRSGGKKTVKQSKQIRFFFFRQFYTIFEQKGSNPRPLCSISFPQGFRISKKFGHWTLWCGSKKAVKRSKQTVTDRQTHKTKTNKKWLNHS